MIDIMERKGGAKCSRKMQTEEHSIDKSGDETFRVLTYNVHSCIGTDRRLDVARVAEVIAASKADIIALQELDVGRARTNGVDQAEEIARQLQMTSHFYPALHVDEEKYGDAIMTPFPTRHVRSAGLPSFGQRRGAIWVEVEVAGRTLEVINTHLGLTRAERMAQVKTLSGKDWLGNQACRDNPMIFAGDLNALPWSSAFRHLNIGGLCQPARKGHPLRPTFPSRFPLLRLDHVFGNHHLDLVALDPIKTPLAKVASDHLPLLATFRFAQVRAR